MKKLLTCLLSSLLLLTTFISYAVGEATFERKLAAAKAGDAEAQYDVAYRYEKGRGVEEDEEFALGWYIKSADRNIAKAQYKVGTFYLKGIGVDEDPEQAKAWLQKSADQGYSPAQYQLGKLYAAPGGDLNYQLAVIWLRKAQDSGYEPATRVLNKVKRKLNKPATPQH